MQASSAKALEAEAEDAMRAKRWQDAVVLWRQLLGLEGNVDPCAYSAYLQLANAYLQLKDVVSYYAVISEGLQNVGGDDANALINHVSTLGVVGRKLGRKLEVWHARGALSRMARAAKRASHVYLLNHYTRYYSKEALLRGVFFNLGAGSFYHPYWTNIDHSTAYYQDRQSVPFIDYDIRSESPLPLASNAAEAFYCSHVIEHIEDKYVANVFKEVRRCLRRGGIFRVTCPNSDLMLKSVVHQRSEYWEWRRRFVQRTIDEPDTAHFFVREIATARKKKVTREDIMAALQQGTTEGLYSALTRGLVFSTDNPGVHINWWNPDKLMTYLTEAGFSDVWSSGRGQSLCLPMQNGAFFDDRSPPISMYVEAVK